MKRHFLFFILILLIVNNLSSQVSKWGIMSDNEIQLKQCEFETDAPAIILFETGSMSFNTNSSGENLFIFQERHVRMKILSEKGIKYGRVEIPYYDFSKELNGEIVITYKAQMFNQTNGADYSKYKLKRKDIIIEEKDKYNRVLVLDFPGLKTGSIIEYKYRIATLNLEDPEDWDYQSDLPVLKSIFRAEIPQNFSYFMKIANPTYLTFDTSYYSNRNISWQGLRSASRMPLDYQPSANIKAYEVRKSVVFNNTNYEFHFRNIPSKSIEPYSTSYYNNQSKILMKLSHLSRKNTFNTSDPDYDWKELTYRLVSTLDPNYHALSWVARRNIRYPSGFTIYSLSSWTELNDMLIKSLEFGMPLIRNWNYQDILDSLSVTDASPIDKMIKIYNYTRDNINWNRTYTYLLNGNLNSGREIINYKVKKFLGKKDAIFNDLTFKNALDTKQGTSAEINLLLTYLLKKAELDAEPVILSTKNNGSTDTAFHSLNQFNHVICRVKLGEEIYFLDATNSKYPYNIINSENYNSVGWLVRNKNPKWVIISNKINSVSNWNISIDIEKNKCTYNLKLTGYNALNYNSLDRKEAYFTINIDSTNIIQKHEDKIILEGNLDLQKSSSDKDIIQLNEIFNSKFKSNPFYAYYRQNIIDFRYPFTENYTITIRKSDSIKFKKIPEESLVVTNGQKCIFQFSIQENESELILKTMLRISYSLFEVSEYSELMQFFDVVAEKLNEEIIIE